MNARQTNRYLASIDRITIDRAAVRSAAESWGKGEEAVQWAEDGIDRFEQAIAKVRSGLIEERRFLMENGQVNENDDAFQKVSRKITDFARRRRPARDELLNELRTVLPESSLEAFENVVIELLIKNARQEATLGGTRIDLMQVIEETTENEPGLLAETRPIVIEQNATLVELADQWMDASIAREISGFTLTGVMFEKGPQESERRSEAEDSDRIDVFLRDVRDELESSTNSGMPLWGASRYLDALRAGPADLGETSDAAPVQGFSEQMRVRRCERARIARWTGRKTTPACLKVCSRSRRASKNDCRRFVPERSWIGSNRNPDSPERSCRPSPTEPPTSRRIKDCS